MKLFQVVQDVCVTVNFIQLFNTVSLHVFSFLLTANSTVSGYIHFYKLHFLTTDFCIFDGSKWYSILVSMYFMHT